MRGSEYPRGHEKSPRVAAVIAVLHECYEAIETGEINGDAWLPNPEYEFKLKPQWSTAEGLEELISTIDDDFVTELRSNASHWNFRGVRKHPQFFRLTDPQRFALAQRIDHALQSPSQYQR